MKRFFVPLLLLLAVSFSQAQTGYNIPITLKPYKNQYIYLGYYYGKLKGQADSILLDANSHGVFKGKQNLPGGIYFIVSPKKEILFEILLDKNQQFSIEGDSTGGSDKLVFTGSPENTLFQSYLLSIVDKDKEAIEQKKKDLEKQYPKSMLALLFRAMEEPVIPPVDKHPGGKYDSVFAYRYFKDNFWSNISFTDDRLLRTPIFEDKLDKYFKDLVLPDADSIKKEADIMLLKSQGNKEMFKFLLVYFIQKYSNPVYMGQDAVFVHIFERYINNNTSLDWLTGDYKKQVYDRAYSLMANLIGLPAHNMELVDTLERPLPLYSVEAPYTVVFFWDPTCSHCKETLPHVDSMFQNKWKKEGIKLYGVMVDGGKEAWLKYIRENNLRDWIHVYQTAEQKEAEYKAGQPNYRQLYDVYQTPVLYLLDKDKRIIAKKVTYEQVEQILNAKKNAN